MWLSEQRIAVFLILLCMAFHASARGAAEEPIAQFIRLEKARLMLEHARAEFERTRVGKEQGINSDLEYKAKETIFHAAELEYEEAVLLAAGAQQQISIHSATKYSRDGKTYAAVTVGYRVGEGIKEAHVMQNWLATVQNITVSLLSDAGVVISLPYEARLRPMHDGDTRTVNFVLLKDVDTVQVVLRYNGKEERSTVYLLRDAGGRQVEITATQYSQDIETGGSGVFDVAFARVAPRNALFRIFVVGLPSDLTYEFIAESGSRVSQISFSDEVGVVKLQLKVYLPKSVLESRIDRPLAFNVICAPPEAGTAVPDPQHAAGSARLEIIPRGSGKIGLQVANLFHEVRIGQPLLVRAKMFNKGTRPIHNVRIGADVPVDWKVQVRPATIPVLPQEGEVLVQVTLLPPADIAMGEYEAKLRPESTAFGKTLEADEQTLRVRVVPRSQNIMIIVLLGVVVALLGVIGYFALRLSRT